MNAIIDIMWLIYYNERIKSERVVSQSKGGWKE